MIFGRGGGFEGKEYLAQAFRETVGEGEGGGEVSKGIVVFRVWLGQGEVGGLQVWLKGGQEFGKAGGADGFEDFGVSEFVQCAHGREVGAAKRQKVETSKRQPAEV